MLEQVCEGHEICDHSRATASVFDMMVFPQQVLEKLMPQRKYTNWVVSVKCRTMQEHTMQEHNKSITSAASLATSRFRWLEYHANSGGHGARTFRTGGGGYVRRYNQSRSQEGRDDGRFNPGETEGIMGHAGLKN